MTTRPSPSPDITSTPALPGVPSSIRTIYVAPMSHLDIGFTAPPDQVAEEYKANIDLALKYLDAYPDLVWNIENVWQLEQWLERTREPAAIEKLLEAHRQGRLGVAAGYANMHSALLSAAEAQHFLYPAEALRRQYGLSIQAAIQNDVPGHARWFPQLLSQAGIRYFLTGPNVEGGGGGGFSLPVPDDPFYWEAPDGSRVLTWVSPESYIDGLFKFKLNQPINEVYLRQELEKYTGAGYPYDAILVQYAFDNWDADKLSIALLVQNVRDWNRTRQNPKIVLARPEDFFRHMAETYGNDFPTYRGDWSGLWEQIKVLSPAGTALVRQAKDHLLAGQTLAALASLRQLHENAGGEVDRLYRQALDYDEHSIGSIVPWPGLVTEAQINHDNALRYELAQAISEGSQALLEQSWDKVSRSLAGSQPGVIVFNPLAWERSGLVTLRPPDGVACPCTVIDEAAGRPVPAQMLPDGSLAFLAGQVPPLGYRRYWVEPGAPTPPVRPVKTWANGVENEFFRLEIDPRTGQLQRLVDLRSGRPLFQAGGGVAFNSLFRSSHKETFSTGASHLVPAQSEKLAVSGGPLVSWLTIERSGTPFTQTRYSLVAGQPWLAWTNVLDRSQMRHVPLQEHSDLYFFAFPLAFEAPPYQLFVETGLGFLDPAVDLLPGANGRGFSTQHVAVLQATGQGAALLVNHQSFLTFTDDTSRSGVYVPPSRPLLISGAMGVANEGSSTDHGVIQLTAGEPAAPPLHSFDYELAFQPEGFDPAAASRLGWEAHQPLLSAWVPAQNGTPLPAAGSFFHPDNPNVLVAEIKTASFDEAGDLVLRLQNLTSQAQKVTLLSAFPIQQAWVASPVEAPMQELAPAPLLQVELEPFQVLTLRLRLAPANTVISELP